MGLHHIRHLHQSRQCLFCAVSATLCESDLISIFSHAYLNTSFHYPVCLIDKRIAVYRLAEQVLIILYRSSQRICMSGKVGHGIYETVRIHAYIMQVGSIVITLFYAITETLRVLCLHKCGIMLYRQKQLDVLVCGVIQAHSLDKYSEVKHDEC